MIQTATNDSSVKATDKQSEFSRIIREHVAKTVVGQQEVVERVMIALLTGGHLLLEGVPGIAKTLLVQTVSKAIDLQFKRVQFTIDLLPSDIVGSEILDQQSGVFRIHKGPVFTNLLLADEINKLAQSEAMQIDRAVIEAALFKTASATAQSENPDKD